MLMLQIMSEISSQARAGPPERWEGLEMVHAMFSAPHGMAASRYQMPTVGNAVCLTVCRAAPNPGTSSSSPLTSESIAETTKKPVDKVP